MSKDFQSKVYIFLERLWLVAAALGVCCVVYFLIMKDNDSALFFFGFFVLSALLYLLRKRQRVKYEKFLENNGNDYEPGKKID
ncbi:hypothetical protein [Aurantibacillus circumpalustris]|uniref:hypothetical protein n=1 Tax=Aurantibacillus circumpalustris TaxID=3036359 RepID=UPI00295BA26A|nr:hypothetical protein [Aurantibacillus circumpalustris]